MNRRELVIALTGLGISPVLCLSNAWPADNYPSKPIRIIVCHAAGTILDVWGRRIADKLSQALGQTVLVDNRPGAGGTLGAALLAKAPPDGYTIGLTAQAELVIGPLFYSNLSYVTLRDFAPITRLAQSPAVLVASPSLGVRSIQELIALAKSKPGQVTAASFGNGTVTHLMVLQLKRLAGIDIVHVPYKDASMALNDVVAGHTSMMFNWVTTSKGFVDSGKLVPLLATGTERLSPFPNTPSATEAGLAGLAISGWAGFTAPIGTPKPILDRLYAELMRIITGPELKIAIADAGAAVIASTPEQFTAVIKSEQRAFAELVKLTGAKIE